MLEYIYQTRQFLRDVYGFKPQKGSSKWDPLLNLMDGEYKVVLEDGIVAYARSENGFTSIKFDVSYNKKKWKKWTPKKVKAWLKNNHVK